MRRAIEMHRPTEVGRAVAAAVLEAPSSIRMYLIYFLRAELEQNPGPVTVADLAEAMTGHNAGA